jgi:hypothetical protein
MRETADPIVLELVGITSPAPRDAWEEALRVDPLALETQSPAWTDAMCAWGGYEDASRLYVGRGGRTLVLPMLRRVLPGRLGMIEGSHPPHCGVGGILAPQTLTPADVATVLDDLPDHRVLRRSFYPNPLLASAWAAGAPARAIAVPKRAHLLTLEEGFEHVWSKRFTQATRTRVRKAEREGVRVECDTSGRLVPVFYDLMAGAAVRWAARQHEPLWLARRRLRHRDPFEKFEAIARLLGERCRVWVARVNGRPVAANVVLQGANAYGFRAAMEEESKGHQAAGLLVRHAIEDACAAGCRYFYMGESGWSESHAVFKERFGGRAVRYAEYRIERLPLTAAEHALKRVVKQAIRFRD